ncbi:GLPGLI family protein [Mucilaginibacter sp. X5P1]|uniref:GLPGLI family protein n=1 Tax=Mucilaginibacter sp. X5P1 TaxID=2723088 RepID=UPI00161AB613|nr:GLPGLI family protein [Mucilaginibacter sp. X5P1]MBB6140073.1 GLPGLI family protein [Mucilaginibacter sp. X5P1]
MKKILFTLTCLLFSAGLLFAQNVRFPSSGTIEFNKTVNIYGLINKQMNKNNEDFWMQIMDAYKKNHPQFKVLKSVLTFSGNKTLYTPLEDTEPTTDFFDFPMADQNNTIYTDLATSQSIIQKKVFEDVFLLKDSTRKINWKITDETREIAGYPCRRANAIVMDSIYVVAFYTDKIHVSGGPETFTGLPGMILGVALPHENVTWFATKVNDMSIEDKALTPPKKGKPVTNQTFQTTLQPVMKNWGDYKQIYLKAFLL